MPPETRPWLEGAHGSLWQKPRTPKQPKREPEPDDHAADFHGVVSLVKEGQLSKACSALLDEAPAPHSEHVAQEMRDRHPPGRNQEETSPDCPSHSRLSPLAHRGPRGPPLFRTGLSGGTVGPQQPFFVLCCKSLFMYVRCLCHLRFLYNFPAWTKHTRNTLKHTTLNTTHTNFLSPNFGCMLMIHDKLVIAFGDRLWRRRLETAATSEEGSRRAIDPLIKGGLCASFCPFPLSGDTPANRTGL